MNISELKSIAQSIQAGEHENIQPGEPVRISEAASIGDEGWQGDLGFVVADGSIPDGFLRSKQRQLVPGNTTGSRHVVADMDTCEVYFPGGFGDDYEGLVGPKLFAKADTVIPHPKHGPVTIPAGMNVQFKYQRVWDAELKRQRRSID